MTVRGRSPSLSAMLAIALSSGCGDRVEVEVATQIADPDSDDPEASLAATRAVLRAAIEPFWPAASGPGAVGSPLSPASAKTLVTHPPRTQAQFLALVEAVRRGAAEDLAGPAGRLTQPAPELFPLVRDHLLADRVGSKHEYKKVLALVGGDVPNRYGTFKLHWLKRHGHPVRVSEDWLGDLLALPVGKVSRALHPVLRDCVLQSALVHGVAHIARQDPNRTADAVTALLEVAYLHEGTFRDEVGRAIQSIGDEALPHLIRAGAEHPGPRKRPEDVEVLKAAYARVQIDRLGFGHPSAAFQAMGSDPRKLVALLSAYAQARSPEATEGILALVDAPSPRVRIAARNAFLAYVTGEAPRAQAREVRVLGGRTTTKTAYVTYRGRATAAIRAALEQDAPDLAEPPCELRREDGEYDQACLAQPHRHTQAYFDFLDLRRRSRRERALADALAKPPAQALDALDRLLAQDPDLDGLHQVIPRFVDAAAAAARDGDHARAAALYRKSAMLSRGRDAQAATAYSIHALLAEARVPHLPVSGRRMLLAAAHDLAREAASPELLDRVETAQEIEPTKTSDRAEPPAASAAGAFAGPSAHRVLAAAAIAALALFLLGAALDPARRRLFGAP